MIVTNPPSVVETFVAPQAYDGGNFQAPTDAQAAGGGVIDATAAPYNASPASSAAQNTAAITAALVAAGVGGTVIMSRPGVYLVDGALEFTENGQNLTGNGYAVTLKAAAGWCVIADSKQDCTLSWFVLDGSALAAGGFLITATNAVQTAQRNGWNNLRAVDCTAGVKIVGTTGAPPSDQVDKNKGERFYAVHCTRGLIVDSTNAEITSLRYADFIGCDAAIEALHGTLLLESGAFEYDAPGQIGLLLGGANLDWVAIKDWWAEGEATAKHVESTLGGWPTVGLSMEACRWVNGSIVVGQIGLAGTAPVLDTKNCYFSDGCQIVNTLLSGAATFVDHFNVFAGGAAWAPVTADAIRHRFRAEGDYRYIGGALISRRNTIGEPASTDADHGYILKSPNGHYWRLTITDAGLLVQTDLGLVFPEY